MPARKCARANYQDISSAAEPSPRCFFESPAADDFVSDLRH
jgi:hypothetical protein